MTEVVDKEMFQLVSKEQLEYGESAGAGPPAKDPLLMLKMCVLRNLHGLSDKETEFQILDRTSFRRFLGLAVSDARTLWLFKERLGAEGIRALFERFHQALCPSRA